MIRTGNYRGYKYTTTIKSHSDLFGCESGLDVFCTVGMPIKPIVNIVTIRGDDNLVEKICEVERLSQRIIDEYLRGTNSFSLSRKDIDIVRELESLGFEQ